MLLIENNRGPSPPELQFSQRACMCLAIGRSQAQYLVSATKGSQLDGDMKDHSIRCSTADPRQGGQSWPFVFVTA